jgi:pyruvate,water dikinase
VSGELLLTVPSLQERPESLIEILRGYIEVEDSDAPQAREHKVVRYREAWDEARAALRGGGGIFNVKAQGKAMLLGPAVRWMHQSIGLRERARLKQSLLYNRFRRVVLALADHFVDEGFLKERDDVFFLSYREIDDLAVGNTMTPGAIEKLVLVRRESLAEVSSLRPPDTVVLPEGTYFTRAHEKRDVAGVVGVEDSTVLRGMGACGGVVEGRAKVLRGLSEAGGFVRGDLLVAKQTDPGWGPLFLLAGGLVMERGGLLSHGAIVAREFGIPAVVGVADAQVRIAHDGRIQIDGDRGLVQVSETSSAADEPEHAESVAV